MALLLLYPQVLQSSDSVGFLLSVAEEQPILLKVCSKYKDEIASAMETQWECPRCGSGAELESFHPEAGGRFRCRKCGYEWSEG